MHEKCVGKQAKGGSFAKDKDFFRFTLGKGEVIPAIEEAVLTMKEGGIRRIVVPVELGYPNNDMNSLGPKPTTFSVSTPSECPAPLHQISRRPSNLCFSCCLSARLRFECMACLPWPKTVCLA